MGTLTVRYEKGPRVHCVCPTVSVEIDGILRYSLADGEEYVQTLPDGRHTMTVRSVFCRKGAVMVLRGDLRLYVKWDRIVGGIAVSKESGPETQFRRPGPYLAAVIIWMALMVALPLVGVRMYEWMLLFLISATLILMPVLAVRFRTIVLERGHSR